MNLGAPLASTHWRKEGHGRGKRLMSWSPQSPPGLERFLRICKRWIPAQPRSESPGRAHSELCPRGFLTGLVITTEFPNAVRARSDFPRRLPRRLPMHMPWVQSLSQVDPLEEEMATHSCILAWRLPRTEMPGGLQSKGSQRTGQEWATEDTDIGPSIIHGMSTLPQRFPRNMQVLQKSTHLFSSYPPPQPTREKPNQNM